MVSKQFSLIGKQVFQDLYIHTDYIEQLNQNHETYGLVQKGLQLMTSDDLAKCNVAKINVQKQRLSFLQYLDFDTDPFPVLNYSFVVDPIKQTVLFRSYSSSLNPPILHRKELLVPKEHPKRDDWVALTKTAEELGLFSSSAPIGFKENWSRLISEKGLKLEGCIFSPIGNQEEYLNETESHEKSSLIQRHLTALSRSSLSAPMQLLIGHGLISPGASVFDYGCGRGDDIRGLKLIGVECSGWDPHYAKDLSITDADIVNLGFVVNVIENPAERIEALQRSFSLTRTALVASVMLHSSDRPGKPYRDGYLTSRNTFQKYFSQDEFKDYLEVVLQQDPIMIGPGIALVFKDKDAEQRFLVNKFRSSNVSRRLLTARLSPRLPRAPKELTIQQPRISRAEREYAELKPILDGLWSQSLDLGRFPEPHEVPGISSILERVSFTRATRLIRTHYDLRLLENAAQTRADEIKLYIASLQFGKKSPYKHLEPKLKQDIRYFFGDYKAATSAALRLLLDSANTEILFDACKDAASIGLGFLDDDRSLQLHVSLVERLPSVLRAYISCGLLLWNNISSVQLVKIHIGSGKLTLLQYDDFDNQPIPLLIKRVKVNIRKLDYDVFDYEAPLYPPSPLLLKSRFMNEDMPGYADQTLFDEALDETGILDHHDSFATMHEVEIALDSVRKEICGCSLLRSTKIPLLDQACGANFSFRQLIECGHTQNRLGYSNLPLNPSTYNALYDLSVTVLDPVIEYFGAIQLTYGFCSPGLASKIDGGIAPKLDQHAGHELNRLGNPICDRLGAAVDFVVQDEDMLEVARWIVHNCSFDRIYYYGRSRPIHVSASRTPVGQVTLMQSSSQSNKKIPKTVKSQEFIKLIINY